MKTLLTLLLGLSLLSGIPGMSQDSIPVAEVPPPYDSLKLLYPFLHLHHNHLAGDTASLAPFFRKLERIAAGSGERVVVAHIGDSHIQPGFVTQPLRDWLQTTYGNAGRGIIFPYRLARSNGPQGYLSRCDTPWMAGRNATVKRSLPTGISGFTLWSGRPGASFTLEFLSPPVPPADTALLVLFHAQRDTCFHMEVINDETGRVYAVWDSSATDRTVYRLGERVQRLRFRAVRTAESQRSSTLYGISLESPNPGVIVHAIGVNGARFDHYLGSEHFIPQLAALKPDLMIFSLGTNEAYATRSFSADTLRSVLDSLFCRIRRSGNHAPVILTTPPGIYKAYRKKRRTHYQPNALARTVGDLLKEYGRQHGMATWDWYSVMGGRDAMAKWKAKKMTDRKYVHFSGKGYAIQGMLFREAFREGFLNHKLRITK